MTDDPSTEAGARATPRRRASVTGLLLRALALVAAGWGLAVWQSPKLAPFLPAPVAAWIVPQGGGGADPAAIDARLAPLADRLAALEDAAERARETADAALGATTGLSDRLSDLDAEVDAAEPADLSGLESRLAGLRSGLDALSAEVASIPRAPTVPPELDQRVTTIESAVEEIRDEADVGDLRSRVAALEAAQEDYAALFEDAEREAADSRRTVIVATALSAIDRAMTLGAPFPEELAELEEAVGEAAPEPLSRAAEEGAPTREALKAAFPDAAHRAIKAALVEESGADQDAMAGIIARMQARVTGLPTAPTEGDSAPAVLSRARFALLNGDLDAALAAIDALPDSAESAMADWIEGARLRSAADHALADWRADIKTTL
jgi:hypothetical protein